MAEEEQQEPVKTFTQEEMDVIIQGRVGKINAKAQETATVKAAELAEIMEQKADLERTVQESKAASMTESEHIEALKKSLATEQAEKAELASQITLGKQAQIEGQFDNVDNDAILAAGGMPKYKDFLLSQLKQSRVIEEGEVFYKDGNGAITDKKVLIEGIATANPELFISGRVGGNTVPTVSGTNFSVDPSKETTEQCIDRRNAERSASS
jgi:hypothetical protein